MILWFVKYVFFNSSANQSKFKKAHTTIKPNGENVLVKEPVNNQVTNVPVSLDQKLK